MQSFEIKNLDDTQLVVIIRVYVNSEKKYIQIYNKEYADAIGYITNKYKQNNTIKATFQCRNILRERRLIDLAEFNVQNVELSKLYVPFEVVDVQKGNIPVKRGSNLMEQAYQVRLQNALGDKFQMIVSGYSEMRIQANLYQSSRKYTGKKYMWESVPLAEEKTVEEAIAFLDGLVEFFLENDKAIERN
jgi:hypothetical protein